MEFRDPSRLACIDFMDDQMTKQRLATISVVAQESACRFDIRAAVCRTARDANQRLFWDITSLYRYLQLKAGSGQPSKWIA